MLLKTKPITLTEKNNMVINKLTKKMEEYVDIIRKKSSQFKGCPLKVAKNIIFGSQ